MILYRKICIITPCLLVLMFNLAINHANADWVERDVESATGVLRDVKIISTDKAITVGDAGQALYTDNAGQTWQTGNTGTTADLYALDAASQAQIIAVGAGGTIIISTDQGANWSTATSGTSADLFGIDMFSSSIGFAVGAGGTILYTSDGGATWQAQTSGTTNTLRGVYCHNISYSWAVGDGGTILFSGDLGTQWAGQNSGTSVNLQAVDFATSSIGFAVGAGGTVLKTTKGGSSWSALSAELGDEDLYTLDLLDSDLLAVAGEDIYYQSDNGGNTMPDTDFSNETFYGLDWYATEVIMIAGGNAAQENVLYSFDGEPPEAPTELEIESGSPTGDQTPTFVWEAAIDHESSIDYYKIKIDSGSWKTSRQTSYTYESNLSAGDHTVYVLARDLGGNESDMTELDFTIETGSPSVSTVTPTTIATGTATTFSVTASDDSGIAYCHFYADSTFVSTMTNTSDNTYQAIHTFADAGLHTAYAACTDESGNTASGSSTSISVGSGEITCYLDADNDGYGNSNLSTSTSDFVCPSGYVSNDDDWCDDKSYAHTQTSCAADSTDEVSSGKLIKLSCPGGEDVNHPCRAVYWYGADGERHAFPNEKVYFTWFTDFDDVLEIYDEQMADITVGDNVTLHPGSKMVRFVSSNQVYAVEAGGILRWVTAEHVANDLYGLNWKDYIVVMSDAFYSNYSFGDDISTATDYYVTEAQDSVSSIDDSF